MAFLFCFFTPFLVLPVQLMFGRFGQVVEKKKSITLQDTSAVRNLSHLIVSYLIRSVPVQSHLTFSPSPGRRSAGSCPVCWAVRSPPCSVSLWSAGPPGMWWHSHAPSTSRVGRGMYVTVSPVPCFCIHSMQSSSYTQKRHSL